MNMSVQSSVEARDAVPVFQAVAQDLAALNVDTAFGLMGEDTAKLVSSLQGVGIKYYGARHENTAVAMADGYARASQRLGVCMISRGPGLTNGLTAVANAAKAGSSILIIQGCDPVQTDNNKLGVDYKAFDNAAVGVASGLTVFSPQSSSAIRTALRDAVAAALHGATVGLMIPLDLIDQSVRMVEPLNLAPLTPTRPPQPAEPVAVELAIEALDASTRPLILAGYGAHRSGARDALIALAERSGALLGTSLRAKDMFRGHPYNVGIVGTYSHTVARHLASQADLVLVFGAALTQFTRDLGEMFQTTRTVHVDTIRSHIGRYSRTDVGVVGDARLVAEQMVEALRDRAVDDKPFHAESTLQRLSAVDPLAAFDISSSQWTIDPRLLITELAEVLPGNRIVATDIGNFMSFVGPLLTVQDPDHYHYPMDFSAIGLGLGLALGIAAAKPNLPTVLFVGDGALLMTLGELETVLRCDLPMIIVVMNDAAYGAEVHYLELEGFSAESARYPDVDFADIATAFGIEASTVRSVDDVRALGPVISDREGAILLDCKVTPTNRS